MDIITRCLEEAKKKAPKAPPPEKKLPPFLPAWFAKNILQNRGLILHALEKAGWQDYARDWREDFSGDVAGLAARLEAAFWAEQDRRDTVFNALLNAPGLNAKMVEALDHLLPGHGDTRVDDDHLTMYMTDGMFKLSFEASGREVDGENADDWANRPPEVEETFRHHLPGLHVVPDVFPGGWQRSLFGWKCSGGWPVPAQELLKPFDREIKTFALTAAKAALGE